MEEKTPDDRSQFEVIAGVTFLLIALAILLLMIIPIPMLLLDILIAINIIFALIIFLIVLHARKASGFSLLPTILLVSTIFSMVLNTTATRLILTKGADFDGRLIRFISTVFFRSEEITDLIIGFAIFIVIIAIHTNVIAKVAFRVTEVARRFTIDSIPIKYMGIDIEYSSSSITEEEAQRRKTQIQKESNFYGSMDGAGKFITGYEKVKLYIIAVIIIGGILIGTLYNGKSVNEAIVTYIPLAVGSGILFLIPSLLVSIAMGITVTKYNFN